MLLSDDAGDAPLVALAVEAGVCDPDTDDMMAEKRMPDKALRMAVRKKRERKNSQIHERWVPNSINVLWAT